MMRAVEGNGTKAVGWRGSLRAARRTRALVLLAVALVASGAGVVLYETDALEGAEHATLAARFDVRGPQKLDSRIALVGLDNESVARLPRWPFSRRIHARMLDRLHAAGARLIVYDVAFDSVSGAADFDLYDAAGRAAPVIFATAAIRHGQSPAFTTVGDLKDVGARVASANLLRDGDGVIRRLTARTFGLETIGVATARKIDPNGPSDKEIDNALIDYTGPVDTIPRISFSDVLRGKADTRALRGKIVVVGVTAPVFHDDHDTSAGAGMSGLEIQANTIATVLGNLPLQPPARLLTLLSILALGFLAPAAGLRFGAVATVGLALLGLALWLVIAQMAFNSGTVVDVTSPVAALILGALGALAVIIQSRDSERRRLRALFAAYSPDLVEQVLSGQGPPALSPTSVIAGYRIDGILGRGGMGVVYRATQLALDRPVAVKVIAAELAADLQFRERFRIESKVAAAIEHPNVIPVYEAGEDDGVLYISMRLVDGVDLERLVHRLSVMSPERAVSVLSQVASALDAAHARGLVHRDVKPANILLAAEEPIHAYLTDFGLAREVEAASRLTRADQRVGTADYLSPEQLQGGRVDGRTDTYALTGVLVFMLTGTPPYRRANEAETLLAHLHDAPPEIVLSEGHDAQLNAVVARGLAKDPADRYPSARSLADAAARALGVVLAGADQAPAPPAAAPRPVTVATDEPTMSSPTVIDDVS